MHDSRDAIIYIGKAVSLRKRVHQYFQASHDEGIKKAQMVKQIARFEYIITDSELEALVLESNLIKEHRPKYNTMLKDDKSYPYIRVTVQEDYPRILFCRQVKRDKSKYFGPYTSAGAVKDTIELMRKVYKIRSCSRSLPKEIGKDRPCLYYQINQCDAPCQNYISKEEYRAHVDKALKFLNGDEKEIINSLEEKMKNADVVVTGEGRLDAQTVMGKAPVGVAALAKKYNAKVIAFAGSVAPEASVCNQAGIDAFFPIVRGVTTLEEAMKKENAMENIAATAEQVFRLL